MSLITLQSIETTAGEVFHAVAAREASVAAELHKLTLGLNTVAPEIIAGITAFFGPTGGGAAKAIIGIINVVDAADQAANSAIAGGVSVSVPAELMAIYRSAKAQILTYENAL